jgi:hypothetical protein
MENKTTAIQITGERRENSMKKRIANTLSSARGLLKSKSGDQMTGWLIVVLVVVVVGAVFIHCTRVPEPAYGTASLPLSPAF